MELKIYMVDGLVGFRFYDYLLLNWEVEFLYMMLQGWTLQVKRMFSLNAPIMYLYLNYYIKNCEIIQETPEFSSCREFSQIIFSH